MRGGRSSASRLPLGKQSFPDLVPKQSLGTRERRLGIDDVHANRLEFEQGRLTGKVTGRIIDGARKAELLREIAAREGVRLEQVIAVGDGANDLPMLSIAGLGIAFRAKPLVKERARHAIGAVGLDGILDLLGMRDQDLDSLDQPA
jgi:phosphoserine phosphatase